MRRSTDARDTLTMRISVSDGLPGQVSCVKGDPLLMLSAGPRCVTSLEDLAQGQALLRTGQ
ncbi:hypothetical protein DEDE109153_17260 [Deinococcus deserti]